MCGLLFAKGLVSTSLAQFGAALARQEWRGPDDQNVEQPAEGVFLGHVRLAIVDPDQRSAQPFVSADGVLKILFNGEIYNHENIRNRLGLRCRTRSDTETVLEGFRALGPKIFDMLDGMFAVVIFDQRNGDCWAARDRYGIKPLFEYQANDAIIYSSECISIRALVPCTVDPESVREWRLIRRPMRGHSFFREIADVLPGSIIHNGVRIAQLPTFQQSDETFDLDVISDLLAQSVAAHEMSDVENVALLSGGIDSSLITALSSCQAVYTVGTAENNEFQAASETATFLGRDLHEVCIDNSDVQDTWRKLITMKGEPLSVPNEALIYGVCSTMPANQKVVLTGEGADEVFFGYDRVFRWASLEQDLDLGEFLRRYGYGDLEDLTLRLSSTLNEMASGKSPVEFVEDFFYLYHLPSLLRRMDFASMAASKEARVPFVCRAVIDFMYRRPAADRINAEESKIPLRRILERLNLHSVIQRKKIGFSATPKKGLSRCEEYEAFQNFNLEILGW